MLWNEYTNKLTYVERSGLAPSHYWFFFYRVGTYTIFKMEIALL